MNPKRKKAEALIYKIFDTLDPTKQNSEYYKKMFASMSDAQFQTYISKDFPFKFQTKLYEVEPSIQQISDALDILGIPFCEKIVEPFLDVDNEGQGVTTHEGIVVYLPLKKTKQFSSKKNTMSIEASKRDTRSGLLLAQDKNGNMSSREFESMSIFGLEKTIDEFSRPRADAMDAKSDLYQTITTTGRASLNDVHIKKTDSVAKNYANAYYIGAGFKSNLVNDTYMTTFTAKDKAASKIHRV